MGNSTWNERIRRVAGERHAMADNAMFMPNHASQVDAFDNRGQHSVCQCEVGAFAASCVIRPNAFPPKQNLAGSSGFNYEICRLRPSGWWMVNPPSARSSH